AIIYGTALLSWHGFEFGWIIGSGFVLERGLGAKFATRPTYTTLRLRGRVRTLLKELAFGLFSSLHMGLKVGIWVGMMTGAVARTSNLSHMFKGALSAALAVSLMFGIVTGLLSWAAIPLPEDKTYGPRDTLRRDMKLAYFATAIVIAVAALGIALGFRL